MSDNSKDIKIKDFKNQLIDKKEKIDHCIVRFEDIWPEDLEESVTGYGHKLAREIDNVIRELNNIDEGNFYLNVSVVGIYSAGKSTFLNSLIKNPGENSDLLPMGERPVTCILTELRPGDNTGYKIETLDGEIKKCKSFEEIEEYVSHVEGGEKKAKKVIVEKPFPDFLSGIRFYDTPGFDSPEKDELSEEIWMDADVILWLMDIEDGEISLPLLEKMKKAKEKCSRNIIVLNKVDAKAPGECKDIKSGVENTSPFDGPVLFYTAENVLNSEGIVTVEQLKKFFKSWLENNVSDHLKDGFKIDLHDGNLKIKKGSDGEESIIPSLSEEYRQLFLKLINVLAKTHSEKRKLHLNKVYSLGQDKLTSGIQNLLDYLKKNENSFGDHISKQEEKSKNKIDEFVKRLVDLLELELKKYGEEFTNEFISKKCLATNVGREREAVFFERQCKKITIRQGSFPKKLRALVKKHTKKLNNSIKREIEKEMEPSVNSDSFSGINKQLDQMIEIIIDAIIEFTRKHTKYIGENTWEQIKVDQNGNNEVDLYVGGDFDGWEEENTWTSFFNNIQAELFEASVFYIKITLDPFKENIKQKYQQNLEKNKQKYTHIVKSVEKLI